MNDEHRTSDAERLQGNRGRLGARSIEAPALDDHDLALVRAIGQCRTQRELDHLLGGLLAVLAGLGPERNATTAEVRSAGGTLACVAGALLLERLLAATANLGTSLGALGSGTTVRQLGRDDLVHDRNVGLNTEQLAVELDAAGVASLDCLERYGSHQVTSPSLRCGR